MDYSVNIKYAQLVRRLDFDLVTPHKETPSYTIAGSHHNNFLPLLRLTSQHVATKYYSVCQGEVFTCSSPIFFLC